MVLGVKDEMSLKRVKKRKLSKDLPDFFEFPSRGGSGIASQPFRDCIKAFLSHHARLTHLPSLFPTLLAWRLDLRSPFPVALHIVEEDVTTSRRSVYCDHCRVVGEHTPTLSYPAPHHVFFFFLILLLDIFIFILPFSITR